MKRTFFIVLSIAILLLVTACKGVGPGAESDPFASADNPGDKVSVIAGSTSFNMIYANASTGTIIPTDILDSTTATINTKFFIAETEATNALMVEVFQWAYDNGRFSSTVGDPNELNNDTAKHGNQELLDLNGADIRINYSSGSFTVDSGYEEHPVTYVTWYGAVMFCNWLTEMRDGNTNNLVYTTIDNTWLDDETTETASNNGYRLPSNYEWELAARFRNNAVNTVAGYSNPWFTKGNSACNATTYYNDYTSGAGEPAKTANDEVAVYGIYYNGSSWVPTGVTGTAEVKSKTANSLGIYDMSGNVFEWCYTEGEGIANGCRVSRCGSWQVAANNLIVGIIATIYPDDKLPDGGFRFARTQ